ncbi:lateral flagellin LafA [Vibrio parahaemolyticus]|uniref:Flagellin n=1 Tax=Vibrio parahaemolyticus TaxID=670 RepID=A0AA46Z371_VIBPH|nr:lateral flagellin LafA [Vibrio parahaemolyticus]EHR1011905.1 lateral flagellin LafA [Vibrio parahaemolyticus]EXJ44654.1 lateral flagellin LafA [Vibrio parahaemolyticus VPTS-2010_2]MCC3847269.1 lateral flagellin LafA [Vibrio parahaemolyticus]UYV28106.1 lateral flagellin LafA [Vibrio parahaemolyticus]HCJ4874071.1 lateral flagellin LafA [Vibrio parahaemolyticus]
MALSMHTNYASLVTQNTMNNNSNLLNTAMERLSTGYRINSAADDAAGLQIANRLEAQTRGMNVAMRNAQDGISMMQTAEGAMDEMTNITYRMKDLATQSINGTNSAEDRAAMDAEFKQLSTELTNIMGNTSFGGQKLLTGGAFEAGTVNFQIGATTAEQLGVSATTQIKNVATGIAALSTIATAADATAILDSLGSTTGLLGSLGTARAEFGANINRLEHTMANLGNMTENTSAAKGRIMDADFAVESSSMTKNQMLMQAGTTVLTKTNQLPGMAMSLLR